MSNIWKFSPSSQNLLKKCIAAGSLRDENNKWVRKFLQKENNTRISMNVRDSTNSNFNQASILVCTQETTVCDPLPAAFEEDDLDNIENDPLMLIKSKKYSQDPKNIAILAQHLPVSAIEKICEHVLYTMNTDPIFIENFISHFIPQYLKRDNSRFTIDLIVQAFKKYSSQFKTLLTVLLKDAGIPCSFIQSLVQSLNEEEKLQFITILIEIPLAKEVFVQHLSSVYLAYKDCSKSEILHRYIFQILKEYSNYCTADKNYGKLFLTFLQTVDSYGFPLDLELTNRLIEIHRSPFKRPCMTIYASLLNKLNLQCEGSSKIS